ncbi:MAG: 4Fe-4S double cluster binding domain-containing protein, partial [Clostridia bacterium]
MSAYCRKTICALLKKHGFRAVPAQAIPLKVAAARAGLGRYGKNALIVTEGFGSWVMFECTVTDAPLEHEDRPLEDAGCRGRDLCIKAWPTGALYAPYKVDRARCITEWLWGTYASPELRELQGDRLFGCGECLMVCPRSRRVPKRSGRVPLEDVSDNPELIPL